MDFYSKCLWTFFVLVYTLIFPMSSKYWVPSKWRIDIGYQVYTLDKLGSQASMKDGIAFKLGFYLCIWNCTVLRIALYRKYWKLYWDIANCLYCTDVICFINFDLWVGTTKLGCTLSVWSTGLEIPLLYCQLQLGYWTDCFPVRYRCFVLYIYYYCIKIGVLPSPCVIGTNVIVPPHFVWLRPMYWTAILTSVREYRASCGCHLDSPLFLLSYLFYMHVF